MRYASVETDRHEYSKHKLIVGCVQASVVCDYSKLNNSSPAQCAPAERIDTRVNDRLPDGAQEYWTVEDIVEAFS
ncbi:hypothetical protein CD006_04200 [Enterobacter sp. 10-1]|nr:hypothetical protein CD006_04200 [Enterobacter sp. 10-1]